MNEESFAPSAIRALGGVRGLVLIGHHADETSQAVESLHLLNLSSGRMLVYGIGLVIGEERLGVEVYEILEPGAETLCFNTALFSNWITGLSDADTNRLEELKQETGSLVANLLVKVMADEAFELNGRFASVGCTTRPKFNSVECLKATGLRFGRRLKALHCAFKPFHSCLEPLDG